MTKPTIYTATYNRETLRSDTAKRESSAKIGEWYWIPEKQLFERIKQEYNGAKGRLVREQVRGTEPLVIPSYITEYSVFGGKGAFVKPQISRVDTSNTFIQEPEISVKIGEVIAKKKRNAERRAQMAAAGLPIPDELQEYIYLTDHSLDKVVNSWLYRNPEVRGEDFAAIARALKALNYRLTDGTVISSTYIKAKTRRRNRYE